MRQGEVYLHNRSGVREHIRSASLYDIKELRAAVERDRDILQSLLDDAEEIPADDDAAICDRPEAAETPG